MSSNPISFVQTTEEGERLRLSWDNRTVPKDNFTCGCLVLFWLIWAPATVFVTWLLFYGDNPVFFAIWLIFGLLGTLLIPYSLLGRLWSEWIEVSPTAITHGFEGRWSPKPKTFPTGPDVKLTLGSYGDETMVTLNVVWMRQSGFEGRAILGYWLNPKIKEQVFQAISTFVKAHKIPLKIIREGMS